MVREIKENELNQLLELYLHLQETSLPEESEHLEQTWQTIMRDENHHIIVKIVDDRIVSSCVCVIIPNLTRGVRPYAFIENVVTHKDYRGKGYAKECLNFAAEIAKQNGVMLCMECHGGTYTDTLNSALELMQAVNSENFRMYWQPHQNKLVEENLAYATLLAEQTYHIHVFNWKEKEKLPLMEAVAVWKDYLGCFSGTHYLLLEFMPDGLIESLPQEAAALRRIVE